METYEKTITMYRDKCPSCGRPIEADSEERLEYYMEQHKKLSHVVPKLRQAEATGPLQIPGRQVKKQ